jgi:hypothetical protein
MRRSGLLEAQAAMQSGRRQRDRRSVTPGQFCIRSSCVDVGIGIDLPPPAGRA